MEQLERLTGLLPESQGQNLASTVLYVPYSKAGWDLAHERLLAREVDGL